MEEIQLERGAWSASHSGPDTDTGSVAQFEVPRSSGALGVKTAVARGAAAAEDRPSESADLGLPEHQGPLPTYGGLMRAAVAELCAALQEPVAAAGAGDAMQLAQSRTRLYRGLALAVNTFSVGPRPAPTVGTVRSLAARERALVGQLQFDLAFSAETTRYLLNVDSPRRRAESGTSRRLARGIEAARLAWDLLATHLDADRIPQTADGDRTTGGGGGGRAVLHDLALLAAYLARLDERLEFAFRAASAHVTTPTQLRPYLQVAADDCRRVSRIGLASYAQAVTSVLAGDRSGVDGIRPAIAALPDRLVAAEDVIAAMDAYVAWIRRNTAVLTISDLATISAIGSRVSEVGGVAYGAGAGGPAEGQRVGAGIAVMRGEPAMRRCAHCARFILGRRETRQRVSLPTGPTISSGGVTNRSQAQTSYRAC